MRDPETQQVFVDVEYIELPVGEIGSLIKELALNVGSVRELMKKA